MMSLFKCVQLRRDLVRLFILSSYIKLKGDSRTGILITSGFIVLHEVTLILCFFFLYSKFKTIKNFSLIHYQLLCAHNLCRQCFSEQGRAIVEVILWKTLNYSCQGTALTLAETFEKWVVEERQPWPSTNLKVSQTTICEKYFQEYYFKPISVITFIPDIINLNLFLSNLLWLNIQI